MNKLLITIFLALTLSLNGCGTILKPKRVNKPHNQQLDYKIVLLDGLGLLLFIVPGVISYAVDYSNGTLFLPEGDGASLKTI
jgi:hypothetical protein